MNSFDNIARAKAIFSEVFQNARFGCDDVWIGTIPFLGNDLVFKCKVKVDEDGDLDMHLVGYLHGAVYITNWIIFKSDSTNFINFG